VNHAATDYSAPVADLNAFELERLFAVDVIGTMLGSR
jgi:hypothetical protein